MEAYAEYSHAIASLVIFTLIVLFMSPVSGWARQGKGLAPGATPEQDYSDKAYRLNRAYLNGTETLPASLVPVARIAMLVVHIRGIGQPHGGLRSILYAVGCGCMVVMGVMTLAAAF